MKLDILVFGAHPDDVELGCGGTIAKHVSLGYKVGVVDLTQGELGTRGTIETRKQEATDASKILKLSVRENLGLKDGFFINDQPSQLKLIQAIRKYQPEIVIANAVEDRHPDHGKGSKLVFDSCFFSGLAKIETSDNSSTQIPWRPKKLYHYIQSQLIMPDLVVDISDFWKEKIESVRVYKTQFYSAASNEPETFISKPSFLAFLEARARELGQSINVEYAEGFTVNSMIGVDHLFQIH